MVHKISSPKSRHIKLRSTPEWKSVGYFQKLFIYFWIFSLFGHYLERIWSWFYQAFVDGYNWHPDTPTFIPLAVPYGFGALAIIIIVIPLIKRYKLNPILVFILGVLVTSLVEYICAAVLVLVFGHNPRWDYSNQPYNINGYICLHNSLLFGLVAMFFIYFIFPSFEKIIQSFNRQQLGGIFRVLLVAYAIDLLITYVK